MFTKILVVTDGSEHGTQAVRTAADIAVKYGAELTVGHVVLHGEPPSAFRRMAEVEHLIGRLEEFPIFPRSVRIRVI